MSFEESSAIVIYGAKINNFYLVNILKYDSMKELMLTDIIIRCWSHIHLEPCLPLNFCNPCVRWAQFMIPKFD